MTSEREKAKYDADMTSDGEPRPAADDLPVDVKDGDAGQYEDDPSVAHEAPEA